MSSEGNSDVSVVILTKNSARTIGRCLQSVVREEPGEILAVDGLSTDASLGILRQYRITVLTEPVSSLGYCRQMGVEAAKGAYVMFVDSDVELAPGCISRLRRELEDHGWAGIHAKLLSAENVSYWQKAEDHSFRHAYYSAGPVNQIDTIAALFRREVLLACPFDAYFRDSYEDVDLSHRLVRASYRLGVSSAVAYHYHRREFRAFLKQRFRGGLGRARFGVKYGEIGTFVAPLSGAFSHVVRNVGTKNAKFIPYWVAEGVVGFFGVIVGLSRIRHSR